MNKKNKERFNDIFIVIIAILFIILNYFIVFFTPTININTDNNSIIFLKASTPTDLDYNFQSNQVGNGYLAFENLKHYNQLTNNYNASYSFINETGLSGTNILFVDAAVIDSGCSANISSNYNQHNEVLRIYDDDTTPNVELTHTFLNAQTSGTIEFFWLTDDIAKTSGINFRESTSLSISIYITNGQFLYYSGGYHSVMKAESNQWFHNKIIFDCSTDTFDWYINGIKKVNNGLFRTNSTNIDDMYIYSSGSQGNYNGYYDAIGFSWLSNYTVGLNINPIIENVNSNLLTNDKYEFDINKNENPICYNTQKKWNPNLVDWKLNKIDDEVYIERENKNTNVYGQLVNYNGNGIVLEAWKENNTLIGVYNNSLDISSIDFLITIDFYFQCIQYNPFPPLPTKNQLRFSLFGLNNSRGTLFRIFQADDNYSIAYLQRYYPITDTWYNMTEINNINNPNTLYTLNISERIHAPYDYEFVLDLYKNNTYECTYTIPNYNNTFGLNKFYINALSVYSEILTVRIQNIGIYNYGISLCREKGYVKTNSKTDSWYPLRQNLISLQNNNFANNYIYGYNVVGGWQFFIISNKSLDSLIWNLYDYSGSWSYLDNATLFMVNNEYINNTIEASITGIKLIQNSYIYYPTYEFSNYVNENDTIFYVSNNRLYYDLEIDNSDKLEYAQITFNINDISSLNRSFSMSYKMNLPYFDSTILLYYTDTSFNYWLSNTYVITTNTILPQNKIIDKITYLITDNNVSYTDNFTGYFSDFSLIYYPNVDFIITTNNFFGIIPIILVVIVIPYLVSIRTKLRFLFLPLIFLMSVIGMIGGLVPYWFGTIICIFVIAYYILTKKFGSD